jgi:hypothetical protein
VLVDLAVRRQRADQADVRASFCFAIRACSSSVRKR